MNDLKTWKYSHDTAHEIIMGLWTAKPKRMVAVRSSDGSQYKTRAIVVLEASSLTIRTGSVNVVSHAKFAKFQIEMDKKGINQ